MICIRRIVDYSVVQVKIAVQKAPMKRATLFRTHEIWITYVVVSVHPRIMARAEGAKVGAKRRIIHRERLPHGLEQVCSTACRHSASEQRLLTIRAHPPLSFRAPLN